MQKRLGEDVSIFISYTMVTLQQTQPGASKANVQRLRCRPVPRPAPAQRLVFDEIMKANPGSTFETLAQH